MDAPSTTDLSIERTMLAHERTLMAWTRTATSLISFGFTIYTFFHNTRGQPREGPLNYVTFSLTMMATGLVSLLLAELRHREDVKQLQARYGAKPRRTVELLAGLIALLGFIGLAAVLFNI